MTKMCNQCANPLIGSKYYDVTCKDTGNVFSANEHEDKVDKLQDREKKVVDEIASADEIKLKKIEEIKKSLRGLSAEELDEELDKLRAEIDELKKDKEERESKSASEFIASGNTSIMRNDKLEFVGAESLDSVYTTNVLNPDYSVLKYIPYSSTDKSGDSLLISMGSR